MSYNQLPRQGSLAAAFVQAWSNHSATGHGLTSKECIELYRSLRYLRNPGVVYNGGADWFTVLKLCWRYGVSNRGQHPSGDLRKCWWLIRE
jgi:hypothetical protein